MLKLSQILDAKRRDSAEDTPSSATSSAPVSPAVSLFSSRGHTRVSSSVSSLVSSPGHGNSMECASRNNCLSGVQEEEPCPGEARDLEQEYFRMCLSLISFFRLRWPQTQHSITSLSKEK